MENSNVVKNFVIIVLVCIIGFLLLNNSHRTPASTQGIVDPTLVMKAQIKAQAEEMGQAFVARNYDTFISLTYPKIVEMEGGKQKMIDLISKGFGDDMKLISVAIGEPAHIVTANNELQTTLPETLEFTVPGGKLVSDSTLIAISSDGGKNWTFIDTTTHDLKTMQGILPNLSNDLVIPPAGQPVLYKDK